MTAEQLAVSAAVDLYARGKLPAHEDAAAEAITTHVQDYVRGRVAFPILSYGDALYALTYDDDGGGLAGIGKALKKAVKKVTKTVKAVAAPVLGVAAGAVTGNPAVGVATFQAAQAITAKPLTSTDPELVAASQAGMAAEPQYTTSAAQTVFGIPEKYLPWAALVVVALLMRT
jgi:hypothetical protein